MSFTPEMKAECTKKALRLGGTLFLVTAITGLILGLVEYGTRDAIEQTRMSDRADALRNVMPEADSFRPIKLTGETGAGDVQVTGVDEALKDSANAGWCVMVSSKGYGGPVSLVVGILPDGVISGMRILTHSETPGLGARSTEPEFYGQFDGKTGLPLKVVKGAAEDGEISAISGATITSTAVVNGVNAAGEYWSKNLAKEGQK